MERCPEYQLLVVHRKRVSEFPKFLAQATLARKERPSAKQNAFYQKALASAPRDALVLQAASFYASDSEKKYDLAVKYGLEATKIDQDEAGAYVALAGVYANLQRWNDLDAIVAESEKNIPDNFGVHYQTAKVLLISGKDLPRAERYLRKYLTMEPEAGEPPLAAAHWRLGQVLEKEGKKTDAIAEMEEAVRI